MNVRKILVAARALIAKGWTQGCFARDENGRPTPFGGPKAVCFCMSGALSHVSALNGSQPNMKAIELLQAEIGHPWLAPWNDEKGRTQAEVLAVYDAAIAKFDGQAAADLVA